MNSYRVGLSVLCLMLSVMFLTGCGPSGPPLAPASGTVTHNGTPVEGANVTLVSVADPLAVANGVTDAQGKFTLQTNGKPGAPIGKNNVGIAKGGMAQMSAEKAKKATMGIPDSSLMKNTKSESELPKKYAGPSSSGLSANVESGKSNDFVFDLTDGAAGEKPAEPSAAPAAETPAEKPAESAPK